MAGLPLSSPSVNLGPVVAQLTEQRASKPYRVLRHGSEGRATDKIRIGRKSITFADRRCAANQNSNDAILRRYVPTSSSSSMRLKAAISRFLA